MKRSCFIIFLLILSLKVLSQSSTYNDILKDFINRPELKNAGISIYSESLKSGNITIEHNPDMSLIPASVFKIIPTAIALETFGSDHKFKTELAYSGKISSDGVLDGNIYIIGYGDPCLGSSNFSHYGANGGVLKQWINEINKLGIKKINGNITVDISYFGDINIPNTWIWEDIGNYYGHQGSALNYMDNSYSIHFSTGLTDGSETYITKVVPDDLDISFKNYVTSSSTTGDEAYIYLGSDNTERIIRGTLPWKKSNYVIKGSLPDPGLYLAKTFTDFLSNNGIQVSNPPRVISTYEDVSKEVIHVTYSPTLKEIVAQTNIKSNNLYAEVLSFHITKSTGKSYKESVIDYFRSKIIDTGGLNIEDACGLSHFNTATSRQITYLLKYMKNDKDFFNSLPIAGINGTLSGHNLNLKNKLYAKSGSMTRIRAYAGYLYTSSGDEIVFCIIVNNFNCKGSQMRKIYDDLFISISKT